MKRYKENKSSENMAVSDLTLISQYDTYYLQDWASNKQQIVEESSAVLIKIRKSQKMHKKRELNSCKKLEYVTPLLQRHSQHQRILRKMLSNKKKAESHHQQSYSEHKNLNSQMQSLKKGKSHKVIAVEKQENRRSGIAKKVYNLKKSEAGVYKSLQPIEQLKRDSIDRSKQLQNLRKMSLPWLKSIPHISVDRIQKQREKKQKLKDEIEQIRKLNEITRNKIKMKRQNKYIFNKQPTSKNPQENQQAVKKGIHGDYPDPSQNQINLLKSWLERTGSKRKRSITSLLREHFEQKYIQKKKQREKLGCIRLGRSHNTHN